MFLSTKFICDTKTSLTTSTTKSIYDTKTSLNLDNEVYLWHEDFLEDEDILVNEVYLWYEDFPEDEDNLEDKDCIEEEGYFDDENCLCKDVHWFLCNGATVDATI